MPFTGITEINPDGDITVTVTGNVAKKFVNGKLTELTFAKDQAYGVWQALGEHITEGQGPY